MQGQRGCALLPTTLSALLVKVPMAVQPSSMPTATLGPARAEHPPYHEGRPHDPFMDNQGQCCCGVNSLATSCATNNNRANGCRNGTQTGREHPSGANPDNPLRQVRAMARGSAPVRAARAATELALPSHLSRLRGGCALAVPGGARECMRVPPTVPLRPRAPVATRVAPVVAGSDVPVAVASARSVASGACPGQKRRRQTQHRQFGCVHRRPRPERGAFGRFGRGPGPERDLKMTLSDLCRKG